MKKYIFLSLIIFIVLGTKAQRGGHFIYPDGISAFESADEKSAGRFDPAGAIGKAVGY